MATRPTARVRWGRALPIAKYAFCRTGVGLVSAMQNPDGGGAHMRLTRTCRTLLVAVAALGVLASNALAQNTCGAFSKLSPGQQKIERALFDAQLQGR